MPASATLPSGTRVPVLCGQPEQKYGVRSIAGFSGDARLELLLLRHARGELRVADALEDAPADRHGDVVGIERAVALEQDARRCSSRLPTICGASALP